MMMTSSAFRAFLLSASIAAVRAQDWVPVVGTGSGNYPFDSYPYGASTLNDDSSDVFMTPFKDDGFPAKIKICIAGTGTCTAEYDVIGTTWPYHSGPNAMSLQLEPVSGSPDPLWLTMARGGLGLCINARIDRADTTYTCDGDGGQTAFIGLADSANGESGCPSQFKQDWSSSCQSASYVTLFFQYAPNPTQAPVPQPTGAPIPMPTGEPSPQPYPTETPLLDSVEGALTRAFKSPDVKFATFAALWGAEAIAAKWLFDKYAAE